MDEAHKELADRLRLATVVETFIGPDGQSDHTTDLGMDAARALEAMAGEVERWKQSAANAVANEAAAEAARDRLKAALEAIQHSQLKRKVAHRARTDGKRSIYDLCEHRVMMKDTCEDCIQDFASNALGDAS